MDKDKVMDIDTDITDADFTTMCIMVSQFDNHSKYLHVMMLSSLKLLLDD